MQLPSRAEVEEIWNEYKTPLHIRDHMRTVNRVAVAITRELISKDVPVILELVDRASLLHDTLRVTEWDSLSFEYFSYSPSTEEIATWEAQRNQFSSTIPHARVNETIFKDRYPEMAHVIGMHSLGSTPFLKTWEERIVNYADRRVAHATVVTVRERLREGFVRYSKTSKKPLDRDPAIIAAVTALEKEIFDIIGADPNHFPFI